MFFFGRFCAIGAEEVRYENLRVFRVSRGSDFANYYFLPGNPANRNLVICLDGRGKHSVLGIEENGVWKSMSFPYLLRKNLSPKFDVLALDRINTEIGREPDPKLVGLDTFQNKLAFYGQIIDEFLETKPEYKTVVLVGYSEGGFILPRLFLGLKSQKKISGLVLCASGGFSFYDNLKFQQISTANFSLKYRKSLDRLDQTIAEIRASYNATDKFYFGWPYSKWAYFMSYRPAEDLKKIDLPLLILHGDKDLNIPVESSRHIVDELYKAGKPNYSYREYRGADHHFNGRFDWVVADIEAWITKSK